RAWMNQAETIVHDEAAVADQKRWHTSKGPVRVQHCLHEIVVGIGFVSETPARSVDGEQTRLRAIEHDVRKDREVAVSLLHRRTRHPQGRALHLLVDHGPCPLGRQDPVSGVRKWRKRIAEGGLWEQSVAKFGTPADAPCRQYDAPACAYRQFSGRR